MAQSNNNNSNSNSNSNTGNNEPADGLMYSIVLGDTFHKSSETKDSFHTAQYSFKPAGVDSTRPGIFRKYENGTLEMEYANKTNKTDRVIFRGNYSASRDVECLLIFENGTLRLERIAGSGKSLKVIREIPSNSNSVNNNNSNSNNNNNANNNNNVNSTTPSPTSSFSTTPSPTSTPPTSDVVESTENQAQPSPIKKGRKVGAVSKTTSASRGKRKSTGQTRLPPIFNPSSRKKSKQEKMDTQTTTTTEMQSTKKKNQNSVQLLPPQPKTNSNATNTTPISTYLSIQKPNVEVILPEEQTNQDFLSSVVVSEELVFSDEDEDLIRDIENSTTQRVVENIPAPIIINTTVNTNLDNTQKVITPSPNTQVISSNVQPVSMTNSHHTIINNINTSNITQKEESSDESDSSDDESESGSESSSSGSSSSGSSSSGSEDESENE